MTTPVDPPLSADRVRELLAIAHLAPLAVDYDDEAWTAAGCPSDKTTRDARDQFARAAPLLARDLLAAREEVERLTRERDEIDATRLGYQAEAMAENARLRAALAELGPRDHGLAAYGYRCPCLDPRLIDPCICGADAHNAKVAAALDVKP